MNLTRMQTAVFFTLYFGVLLCGIYVFQCADTRPPSKKDSFLANVNRYVSNFLLVKLPNAFRQSLKFVVGETVFDKMAAALDYTINQRNPLLQILYMCLINGAYLAWLVLCQSQLPVMLVPAYHKWIIFVGIAGCQGMFYLACTTSPGVITAASQHAHVQRYPFDGTVYAEGLLCATCRVPKAARSKHCRLCNACVSRFDHHCVWLNQCVGGGNHRFFLGFLLLHAVFLLYCSYICAAVLLSEVYEKRLFQATFMHQHTRRAQKANVVMVLKYLLYHQYVVVIIFALVFVMWCAMVCFLGYHLHLVKQGTTTNETHKWEDAVSAHQQLSSLRQQYLAAAAKLKKKDNQQQEQQQQLQQQKKKIEKIEKEIEKEKQSTTTTTTSSSSSSSSSSSTEKSSASACPSTAASAAVSLVTLTPVGAFMRGFDLREQRRQMQRGEQCACREEDDCSSSSSSGDDERGSSSTSGSGNNRANNSRGLVYYPDPGDVPENIYNRGFLANLSDILWPVLVVPPAPASITRTETEEREEEKKEKKERGAGDGAAVQEGARRRKHKASKQH